MAIPHWTVELLRRGINDVARKAREPETIDKIKSQATEILQDLPNTAARGIDAVIRSAEAGKRSVEKWSRKHTALAIPMLNASGVLQTDAGTGVALSESAIEVGRELLSGDVVGGAAARQRTCKRLQRLVPSSDDHAIAITSNFSAAMTAFSLLVQQRQLVVHRSHAVSLPGGLSLPDAFGVLVPVIQEVGSVNRASVQDFDGLDSFCAILADGGERPVELFDFSESDAMQAVVLPYATLSTTAYDQIPSAESMLSAGADFVIMPGDGLAGGPQCGVLIGPKREMQQIEQSNAWPALAASDAVCAMAIVAFEEMSAAADHVPLLALLHTSDDNLRGRAERMATRLSSTEDVASIQVTAEAAKISETGRWRFPSRQLRLRHSSLSAAEWADNLREDIPAMLVTVDGDDLCVDLRWIAASDDGKVAEALAGIRLETGV